MTILDTLRSLVTGLGTAKDKTTTISYAMHRLLSDAELNAMHRTDWLARKIVDIIPNDMTREWRDWQAEAAQIEAIEAVENMPLINTQLKVNEAMRKARLLRGAVIYMGLKGANPEEPLELDRVKKGDLQYLNVVNRRDLAMGQRIMDVASEFYGEPEYYEIQGQTTGLLRIHPSRVIRFCGADVLDGQDDPDGWGDSILQIVYDAVQNATSVQQHIAALIPEAKVDVIYVPRLSDFLRDPTTTQKLTERFAYANTVKSSFNMVLLEGNGAEDGEKWEQKQIGFAQLPEIMQQFLQIASGAADIPVTRLLGQSPAGLNSTGESDIRNYYDNISARQKTELKPRLYRLDEVTIRSALGSRPDNIYYDWSPLWGLSDKEKADIFSTKVTAARNIAGSSAGPLMPIDALSDALVNTLIEDASLPGLEDAIEEYGKLSEQEDDPLDVAAAITPRKSNVVPLKRPAAAGDAEPRTLYVRRDVINAAEITAWAKGQGMTDIVDDLHVTIVYSRAPIDWIKAGNSGEWNGGEQNGQITIPPGGPRVVEPLGNMSAVLMFASSALCWRHEDIVRAGASHDYNDYQPHISLTKAPVENIDEIEPYRGAIVLGPEVFEELDPSYGDANPYHEPAGTFKGGQFASKPGGVGGTYSELEEDHALVQKFREAEAAAAAIPPTDQIDTPERNALRARIADELYNTNIDKRARGREATILLGLPGVGKSTFANPLLANGALEIDPDLAKAKIPEFAGGIGANAVHEESSMITRTVLGRAVANGDNFVWPRIDNPGRIKDDITNLKAAGYKVNVIFLDSDPRVAIKSVIDRFEKTGRYVSPLTVQGYGDTPRESAKVAQLIGVDSYEEYYRGEGEQFRRVK